MTQLFDQFSYNSFTSSFFTGCRVKLMTSKAEKILSFSSINLGITLRTHSLIFFYLQCIQVYVSYFQVCHKPMTRTHRCVWATSLSGSFNSQGAGRWKRLDTKKPILTLSRKYTWPSWLSTLLFLCVCVCFFFKGNLSRRPLRAWHWLHVLIQS